jgi:hypothetical protein
VSQPNFKGTVLKNLSIVLFAICFSTISNAASPEKNGKANDERLKIFDRIWRECGAKYNKASYNSAEVVKVMKGTQEVNTETVRVKATLVTPGGKVLHEKLEILIKSDFRGYKPVMYAPNANDWIGSVPRNYLAMHYDGCARTFDVPWQTN